MNLNFDVTTSIATYSGVAVVDYVFQFAPNLKTFTASCQGKIFATGTEPFDPASVPVTTFDCAYLGRLFLSADASAVGGSFKTGQLRKFASLRAI